VTKAGRYSIAVLLIIAVGCAALWLAFGREPDAGLVARANVVGGAAALVAIVLTPLLRRRPEQSSWLIPDEQLDAACGYLARATEAYWRDQARTRGINAPIPAAVRWRWSDGDVAAPVGEVAGDPATFSEGVVTELGKQLYEALPNDRARIFVSGVAGSGKTATMLLLLLDVVKSAGSPNKPVPVWLTLGSWNPRTTVADWVTAQLVLDFPGLQIGHWPAKTVARELYERGRLALFMDGLDEMPEPYREGALARLNATEHVRFVLTSRPGELRRAISRSRVFGASVVETLPLTPAAANDFLLREQLDQRRQMWLEVVRHVEEHPDCPVAEAFQTPLALSLAREIYMASSDPRELLDESVLASADEVMNHLLRRFLHLAYPVQEERSRAVRRLRWIALRISPSRDLAWWRIPKVLGLRGTPRRLGLGALIEPAPTIAEQALSTRSGRMLRGDPLIRLRVGMIVIMMVGTVFAIRLITLYSNVEGLRALDRGESGDVRSTTHTIVLLVLAVVGAAVLGRLLSLATDTTGGSESRLPAMTPVESFQGERKFAVRGAIAVIGLSLALIPLVGVWIAFAAGLTGGLFFAAGPAVGLWLVELSLPFRGLGRLRMIPFLDDALKRQVLRQVGPVYQFRHAAIQDYLMSERSSGAN